MLVVFINFDFFLKIKILMNEIYVFFIFKNYLYKKMPQINKIEIKSDKFMVLMIMM